MIDQEQYEKARLMFSTAGWNDVIRPSIENRMRQRIKALMLFPSERQEAERDDAALRGAIAELEWMLVAWQNELTVFEHNKQLDELQRSEANGLEPIETGPPANP